MEKTSVFTKNCRISWAPRLTIGLLLFAYCCDASQEVFADHNATHRALAGARHLSLYPEFTASFDANFNTIDVDLTDPATNDPSYIHQINIYAEVTGLEAGEDFANTAFNIELGPGLSMSKYLYGWKAHRPGTPNDLASLANPETLEFPSWFFDGDFYTNADWERSNDLEAIVIISGPRTARVGQLGEIDNDGGQRLKLGTIYVQWDGLSNAVIRTTPWIDKVWSVYTNKKDRGLPLVSLGSGYNSRTPRTSVWFGEVEVIQDIPLRFTETNARTRLRDPATGRYLLDSTEFLEITNISDQEFSLDGYRLGKPSRFAIDLDGFNIAAGESLVVVRNKDAFELKYGVQENLIEWRRLPFYSIGLIDPNGDLQMILDLVGLRSDDPMQEGYTLEIVDPTLDGGAWNDRENWKISDQRGGTPGYHPGIGTPPTFSAVPEPSALLLAVLGLAISATRQRRSLRV